MEVWLPSRAATEGPRLLSENEPSAGGPGSYNDIAPQPESQGDRFKEAGWWHPRRERAQSANGP